MSACFAFVIFSTKLCVAARGISAISSQRNTRGKGFATEGLRLTLEYAESIVPEAEYYLRVNKENPASLRVMIKNGGRIVGETEDKFLVRIPK